MTNSAGTDVNRYVYDPSGTIISQQEQSGLNNPWKFAAGYLDSSTGLYKFGVRYYDPTLGRWTQQDPVGGSLGDLNSANRYVYAGDDPVNAVDPSGSQICIPGNEALAILLGAGALVFGILAFFATPAVIFVVLGVEVTGQALAGTVAAILGFQALITGFTTSSAPVCF